MKKKKLLPKVLTIAGSDPSGGAGVQADLRTFQSKGLLGASVITAVTAQNESEFISVNPVSTGVLQDQLRSVGAFQYVKIGMLGTRENVSIVIDYLKKAKPKAVILDPIFCSSTGRNLLTQSGVFALKKELLPLCTLVTPNLSEAEILSGVEIRAIDDMKVAAKRIYKENPGLKSVLIKGGHLKTSATDLLYDGSAFSIFKGKRRKSSFHGTGCVLSSLILSGIAQGYSLKEAVMLAKKGIAAQLKNF